KVESIGVTRAIETVAEADLALIVVDGSRPIDEDDQKTLQSCCRIAHMIIINKSDLPPGADLTALNGEKRVTVSAKTGEGLNELLSALRDFLMSRKTSLNDDLMLTNVRQY